MLKNLFPDQDILVAAGYLYLPLWLDPNIDEELGAVSVPEFSEVSTVSSCSDNPTILRHDRRYFVKSINLSSLLNNYAGLQPQDYHQLESHCLNKYLLRTEKLLSLLSGKLKTILMEILPHFLKVTSGRSTTRPSPQDVLAFLQNKVSVPESYQADAVKILAADKPGKPENGGPPPPSPPVGLVTAKTLRQWLYQALAAHILTTKKSRLRQALKEVEDFIPEQAAHLPLLLFLAETGTLEIDGFGFWRHGRSDDYIIYKRTGEYALKDYYGRLYLFPDCRVAVFTRDNLHPFVLDKYKHPFLLHHRAGQRICLRHFTPPTTFSAWHVITALEEGLNALYHGYDYRRRNGYHSLDSLPKSSPVITFDDLLLPPDHPKILSREIEVKNDFR